MTYRIFTAKAIHTMNRSVPRATAVAVKDGRVLCVGSEEECASWGDHEIDRRFENQVLLPGFVEAHCHVSEGFCWNFTYVGYFDRTGPDGRLARGSRSNEEAVTLLRQAEARLTDPTEPLIAWGYDPIYFDEQMDKRHLDSVSTTRPIFVLHASQHLATVNQFILDRAGEPAWQSSGVIKDDAGVPTGVLSEFIGIAIAADEATAIMSLSGAPQSIWNLGYQARNAGVTTVTDLANTAIAQPEQLDTWRTVTSDEGFPARTFLYYTHLLAGPSEPDDVVELLKSVRSQATDKMYLGYVKMILDGSIQGWSAQIAWPGYYTGVDHGTWNTAPEQAVEQISHYFAAGVPVQIHCNGDLATQVAIEGVEAAVRAHGQWDHRYGVQHCQLTTAAQYAKMSSLGMVANIFANHLYYWGDQHRDLTIGPERARSMDAAASALAAGVPISFHSDAAITPLGGLFAAWCAVNRLTATGDVLGHEERISVEDALHAVTLGAAYQLHADHLIGSIEHGKFADFCVLDEDPYEVDPVALRDINVWGTVLGGVVHERPTPRAEVAG
jgi:predicted amidohydrolase YtcJ